VKILARNLAVTGTSITVTFPAGTWFVAEPAVLVTVLGAPTDVGATLNSTAIDGIGNAYTSLTLTFQAGAVGRRFSLLVAGD
jgi:hypothetical protein